MLRISHNELLNTIEKAFEAMGFRPGERAEAAEAIAWLERHGLEGVAELGKALDHMPGEAQGRLVERYRDGGLRVFSADGQSILNSGGLAVDTALSMAQRYGLATVRIEECHNRALIAGFLTRAVYQNTGVLACWSNRHQSRLHLVWHNGADRFPSLRVQARPRAAITDQSLTLIASCVIDLQPHLPPDTDTHRLIQVVDPEALRRAEQCALSEGLNLSERTWDTLKRIATGVLVDDQHGGQ
jgi:LDH2 family malate/lactate/ureidoglycolate dehydrogenase